MQGVAPSLNGADLDIQMPKKKPQVTSRWICPLDEYVSRTVGEMEVIMATMPYVFSREWAGDAGFGSILRDFKLHGCCPSISLNGKKWRFYINTGTTMFDESDDLRAAFRKALKKWLKAGSPRYDDSKLVLYVRESKNGTSVKRFLQWRKV